MERSTKIGIGFLILLIVGGFWFTSSDKSPTITGNVVQAGGELSGQVRGGMRHINVDAKRFDFGEEIRVKQGEDIMLMINNIDTTHGIKIPALGVAGNNMVTFTADKKGEFDFYCNTYCGAGHMEMSGKIIVE